MVSTFTFFLRGAEHDHCMLYLEGHESDGLSEWALFSKHEDCIQRLCTSASKYVIFSGRRGIEATYNACGGSVG